MNWDFSISDEAEKQLARFPKKAQGQIARAIELIALDPFAGDVVKLAGREWEGAYRKHVGRYRIFFTIDHQTRSVGIAVIRPRNKHTYR